MLEVLYNSVDDLGNLSPFIGWIDFGPELYLDLEHPTKKVENTIPGSYQISFDITYGQNIDTSVGACYAAIPPIDQTCPFGLTDYRVPKGNIALSITSGNLLDTISTLKLEHIMITDQKGNVIPDYILYVANAKHTCITKNGVAERLTLKVDQGNWSIADSMALSQDLEDANPKLTGAGTSIVTEEGSCELSEGTKSYIYATLAPKAIEAEFYSQDGFSSIAIGIMLLSQNRECPAYLTKETITLVQCNKNYSYYYDTCGEEELISFTYYGQIYPLKEWPIFIKSEIGIYIFYKHHYFLFTNQIIDKDEYDLFVFNTKCRKREFVQPVLFSYLS